MYMLENGKIDVAAYMQHVRDTKARIHGKAKTQPVVMLPKKSEEVKDEEKAKPLKMLKFFQSFRLERLQA